MAGVGGVGGPMPDPNLHGVSSSQYTPDQKAAFREQAKEMAERIKHDLNEFIYNWKSGRPQDDHDFFAKMKENIDKLNKFIGDHLSAFGKEAQTASQGLKHEIDLGGAYAQFEIDMGMTNGDGGEPDNIMNFLNDIIKGC